MIKCWSVENWYSLLILTTLRSYITAENGCQQVTSLSERICDVCKCFSVKDRTLKEKSYCCNLYRMVMPKRADKNTKEQQCGSSIINTAMSPCGLSAIILILYTHYARHPFCGENQPWPQTIRQTFSFFLFVLLWSWEEVVWCYFLVVFFKMCLTIGSMLINQSGVDGKSLCG